MNGGQPGEHGIMGIGDGFVPDLVDPTTIYEIATVSTDEAREVAQMARRIAAIALLSPALDANYLAIKQTAIPWHTLANSR